MLPALKTPDSSIDLLREGYTFIPRRCDRLGTDGFRARLLLKPVTCIHGAGEYADNHRWPGEPITIGLMRQAVQLLTRSMSFMPSLPEDGFIIHDVRPRESA